MEVYFATFGAWYDALVLHAILEDLVYGALLLEDDDGGLMVTCWMLCMDGDLMEALL